MDKISIIVPVYNVEDYLEECIESIVNQTYKNLEIILVNDGSTDCSGYICDKYNKKDFRIKVIHKKNGGLSSARNVGIDFSTGNYLMFVDSDDYIDLDMVEILLKYMEQENADITICNFYREKNKKMENVLIKNYFPFEAIKEIFLQKNFETSAWGKLFKREVFKEIYFPEGKIFEDLGTIYKVFDNAKKITYISAQKYFYRFRVDSIMNSKFDKKKMDIYDIFKGINNFLLEKYPDLIPYLRNRETKTYINNLISICASDYRNKEDINKLKVKIKENFFKYVFFNKNITILEKIFGISFYINFEFTKKIILFLKKIKSLKKRGKNG